MNRWSYRYGVAVCAALLIMIATAIVSAQPLLLDGFRPGIRFVQNRGQIVDTRGASRPDVLYSAASAGVRVYLRRGGLSYVFMKVEADSSDRPALAASTPRSVTASQPGHADPRGAMLYRMDVDLVGASMASPTTAEEPGEEYCNFYLPGCREGITGVRSFGRVIYRDIYPHIDLAIYGMGQRMKYDFIVHPGGRVEDIRLQYRGAAAMALDDGAIVSRNPLGRLREAPPQSYQGADHRLVASRYLLVDGMVGFDVGEYDRRETLVIDPTLDWATYLGGAGEDFPGVFDSYAERMVQDRSAQLVLGGTTISSNFPASIGQLSNAGSFDAFVARFSDRGARRWITYYGGSNADKGYGVTIDALNNVILGGVTASPSDFPVTTGAYQTTLSTSDGGFLLKLDSMGRRLWCTFYGGYVKAVAADSAGNLLLGGAATASGLATTGTFQVSYAGNTDAFIAKFSPGGGRVWATYCGGTSSEEIESIAIDRGRNVVATGWNAVKSSGNSFPVTSGAFQMTTPLPATGTVSHGFVVKLDSNGLGRWCTYLAGTQLDWAENIAVDNRNNVIITGLTESPDFPVAGSPFQSSLKGARDGFLTKLDSAGSCLWSTYYGGDGSDAFIGLGIDEYGRIAVGGYSSSVNFPLTIDAFQTCPSITIPVSVVVTFDSTGKRVWATMIGNCNVQAGVLAVAYRFGMFAISGVVSMGGGMPTSANSFQQTIGGGSDVFIAKLCEPSAPRVQRSGPLTFCDGDSVVLTATSGYIPNWVTASGGVIFPSANATSITVKRSGKYWFTTTRLNCSFISDTMSVTVNPRPQPVITPNGVITICERDSVVLDAGSGYKSYRWSTGDTVAKLVVRQSGVYSVTVTNFFDCSAMSQLVQVVVNPRPHATISAKGPLTFCEGDSLMLVASPPGFTYLWSNGATSQSIIAAKSGTYSVTVFTALGCMETSSPVTVKVNPRPEARIVALTATAFCAGDSAILQASMPGLQYRWSTGETTRRIAVRNAGSYSLFVTDSLGCSTNSPPVVIQIYDRPHPKIVADGPLKFCAGDSVTLDVGNSYASYVWSTGFGSQKIVVKESGRYSVTVTNDVGCGSASDTVVVQVNPRPRIAINGPSSVCANAAALYNATSAPGVSSLWSVTGSGTITGDPRSNTVTIQWGAGGSGVIHLHAVLDSSGCSVDTSMAVSVGSGLVPEVTSSRGLKLCAGDSVTLDAGSYSRYQWSTGGTSRTITVRDAGSYTVMVSDGGGCSGMSKPVIVSVNPDPKPEVTASRGRSICQGDSTVLDAGAGYARYTWSNGYTTRYLTARSAGIYTVTVTDSNGCIGASDPIEVTIAPPPVVEIHGPVQVCKGSTVSYATATVAGAAYTWTVTGGAIASGQGSSTVAVQWNNGPGGTVMLNERTSGGCVGTTSIAVAVGERLEPVITASGSLALCEGSTVTLDAGAGYTSYAWSSGEKTQTIVVGTSGAYMVTVTDANGCTGRSQPLAVTVDPIPDATVTPAGPITLCDGDSATLTAATEAAGYRWSTGSTDRSIVVRHSGAYSVTVTSSGGCVAVSSVVAVTVLPAPEKPEITAKGDTLTSTPAGSYQWSVDGKPITGGRSEQYVVAGPGSYRVTVAEGSCTATSDPWVRVGQPMVWLDTVSAAVGDRVRLHLSLSPGLTGSEKVTGYRVVLKLPTRGLFPHRVIDTRAGGGVRVTYQADGTFTVERHDLAIPASGGELFALEVEGLTTAQPLNVVGVASVELEGLGALPVIGEGLVILSGCDVGRNFAYGKRASIVSVQPNPIRDEAAVTYRAPQGAEPTLRLYGIAGEEVLRISLPAGTGADQTVRMRTEGIASGFYRLDLRNGDETSTITLFIRK